MDMDVNVERVGDDQPNRFKVTLPEGSIEIVGTPGFVTGLMRAIFADGSVLRHLVFEHTEPEELHAAWRKAARRSGVNLEDIDGE